MSRVGRRPIPIPDGVKVVVEGRKVTVSGPKGELERELHEAVQVGIEEGQIVVRRPSDDRLHRALHGLSRTLVANMVHGVSDGYEKVLEVRGVGYRAAVQGKKLTLQLGYSRPVEYELKDGIEISVDRQGQVHFIVVKGIDKQLVGQTAAEIRALKKPEPYKGSGIRYRGEQVRRKAGKSGVTTTV
jgi:large subunit ribosomal protein L6